jgi:hypothetical protein
VFTSNSQDSLLRRAKQLSQEESQDLNQLKEFLTMPSMDGPVLNEILDLSPHGRTLMGAAETSALVLKIIA